MAKKSISSVDIASSMFRIPIRRYGNFDTEQAKFVHLLRMRVNELQRGFHKESELFYDKMKFKEYMIKSRIYSPKTYSYLTNIKDFKQFWDAQENIDEFVIKPNHLSQGKYIYVIEKKYDEYLDDNKPEYGYIERHEYIEIDGTKRTRKYFKDISQHILKGSHVYKGIIMEERVHSHETFKKWSGNDGLADLRAYVLYDTFLFGKLRLPCKASHFYGNTGRNAFACFVNENGIIENSDLIDNIGITHPDTHISLKGEQLPCWEDISNTILTISKLFKMPFHSVDLTVDRKGRVCAIESEKIPYLSHFTKRGAIYLKSLMDEWGS